MCVYVYMCRYVCMHMRVYMYIYTHMGGGKFIILIDLCNYGAEKSKDLQSESWKARDVIQSKSDELRTGGARDVDSSLGLKA